jgi:hypothetical protein
MANLESAKFIGYAVVGNPRSVIDASKFIGYAVDGAGSAGKLTAAKFIAYGVLTEAPPGLGFRVRLIHMPMVLEP